MAQMQKKFIMDLTQEAKRRSSLFGTEDLENTREVKLTGMLQVNTLQYPPAYLEKMEKENKEWPSLLDEYSAKTRVTDANVLVPPKLTDEQNDFLSSLPNYEAYTQSANTFLIKHKINLAEKNNQMKKSSAKCFSDICFRK